MKTNAIIRIVLFSIAILVLLGILASFLLVRNFVIDLNKSGFTEVIDEMFSINDSGVVSVDGTGRSGVYDATQINELEIDWVAGTIVIQPGDTNAIHFEESAVSDAKYQLVAKQSGDKLVIEFCEENFSGFTFNFGVSINNTVSKDLVITVPADWECESLEIDTASARVEVQDLNLRKVEFDGASGLCIFDNCMIEKLDIDTASGNVRFSGTLETLDFDAASANFNAVLQNVPQRLTMDSMSGDLDITLPAECGFTASVDVMSGDFSSEFPTSVSKGNYSYGDGSCRIDVVAMSGDITVRKGQ